VLLVVNILSTSVNAVLDYALIFGHLGLPRAGVAGAALATVMSQSLGALILFFLMMRREHRAEFGTLSGWRLDLHLLGRLLRYGVPTGLQYSLEVLSFTLFLMLIGRVGTQALAASSIAFNLNSFVFWPMLGMGIGVASLVGRYLGAERPDLAERSARSAFAMSMVYMTICCLCYLLLPGLLLRPYAAGADPRTFGKVAAITRVLLRYVAVYSVFDMMNVVFAFALRGAGDTVYPLLTSVALSVTVMLVPAYVLCTYLGGGIYTAWTLASLYVMAQGLLMWRRFRQGQWKSLRVIDRHE
jgi:MATE family multidrug resistance protein